MKKLLLLAAAAWVVNELFLKSSGGVDAPLPDHLEGFKVSNAGLYGRGQQVIGGRRTA